MIFNVVIHVKLSEIVATCFNTIRVCEHTAHPDREGEHKSTLSFFFHMTKSSNSDGFPGKLSLLWFTVVCFLKVSLSSFCNLDLQDSKSACSVDINIILVYFGLP